MKRIFIFNHQGEKGPKAAENVAHVTIQDPQTENQQTAPSSPAVSFQVLPESAEAAASPSSGTAIDSSSPNPQAEPPPRKTSFTVLKSDESIEEVVDKDGNPRIVRVVSAKPSARPKSFKVLAGSFETADDEAGPDDPENEDDDDDVNLGGEFSDSELIKSGGIAIKRRKRLKKRAKSSVKQIFATDSGPGGLNRQHSKDQDSGFEPSPRAMRSTKTSRSAYTALPERTRNDVPDGRTCSSRLEKRKPGDKKSVNMTTVSQSIQRNIRRLVSTF